MNNRYISLDLVTIGMAVSLFLFPCICRATTNIQERSDKDIREALNALRNPTSKQQFNDAVEVIQDVKSEIDSSLIEALKKENKSNSDWRRKYGEMDVSQIPVDTSAGVDAGATYCDLLEMVCGIRSDAVLPTLIESLGHGMHVEKTVADYGETAVPLLVKALTNHPDALIRSEAADTLGMVVTKFKLSSHNLDLIKTAIKQSLDNKDGLTRRAAVCLVGRFGDLDFVEQIRKLSQEDQYKWMVSEEGAGVRKTLYPVRDEAVKTLKLLLKHKQ